MPAKVNPDKLNDAFELYLEYNGERFDLVQKEMRSRGWKNWNKSVLSNRGRGKHFREGWIERYGWSKALEIHIATKGKIHLTSAESVLYEIEFIRKKLFHELNLSGVKDRLLVSQHEKYSQRSIELLSKLDSARDNYGNFIYFLQHLLKAATSISPNLAVALSEAEEGIIDWAESQFVTDEQEDD